MTAKSNPLTTAACAVDPRVRIGHVHLKVADLPRAVAFYAGVLGLEVMQRYGDGAVFLSAGGYHHHIALNTWESRGGSPPTADRALPYGDCLSESRGSGDGVAASAGSEETTAGCGRSRRERIDLPQ
jgi:catechol-2,3-dioxygenase